ncbi:MAG: luciferase-like monooxygenase family [Candidatus Acidoferrum typicum]|nr:luciferase-like monooxygenase family [Candidatus Acidoferrum typicum]
MNILLVGEESVGIRTLRLLAGSRHKVVGVLASQKPRFGGPATLWKTARELGYRTWAPENVRQPAFARQVREDEVDLLLNIHSLYLIHTDVLRAPKIGSFNLHPGPLPRFAGLNPVCWALYFGEKTHGVTLHRMTAEIDAGPIVYQSVFPITETDTGLSVSLRCMQEGLLMVPRLLAELTGNPVTLPEIPQDLTQRRRLGREVPHRGRIIWSLPARQVVNFVRACNFCPFLSPWGYPQTRKGKCDLGIATATLTGCSARSRPGTVGGLDDAGVRIACSDEWISVGKVSVREEFLDAVKIFRVGDQLENGAES